MSSLDSELVRHALTVARKHGYAEVEIAIDDDCFSAKLDPAPKKAAKSSGTDSQEDSGPALLQISATLVGYYREAKNPLRVGSHVKKGDIVANISALGIANDVESKVTGEVVEVLVEPNQPVEYGQALARVKS